MSLVTQAFIFEKYGPRLGAEQICSLLGITTPALYNQLSAGTCRLKTYMDGGKRWADYRGGIGHSMMPTWTATASRPHGPTCHFCAG